MTAGGGPDRGVAVRDAARAGARGRVVSVHRKAVYLDLDGALVALVAPGVEAGPLHLRVGSLPETFAGEPVHCDGSRIAARWWAARCDVPVWEGALPRHWTAVDGPAGADPAGRPGPAPRGPADERGPLDASALAGLRGAMDRLGPADDMGAAGPPGSVDRLSAADPPGWTDTFGPAGRSGALPARDGLPREVPADPAAVRDAARRGDVEELARLLGGRGPGLTPAGDDLLAGLLLVARARWGPRSEPRLVEAAASVPTTGPARAFLHWAARGQSLAPAHDLLVALAEGDPVTAARAGRVLDAIGAGSGRCLHAGLRNGLAQLPRPDTQNVRAGPGAVL